MKIHSLGQLAQKPWKNGQGMTTEIVIDPPEAVFSEEKFNWRISCAEVNGANDFSQFKDFNRVLLVWKGDGILLNGKKLAPFVSYQFDGEQKIHCELVGSKVLDLGVIYRKTVIECEMKVLSGNFGEAEIIDLSGMQNCFLFLAEGLVQIQGISLKPGDCLEFKNQKSSEVKYLSNSQCVQINLMKTIP